MKQSRLLAVLIIMTVALTIVPAQQVHAAQPYSEKLTAYVAGSSALWFMSFNGINATAPGLVAVEAIQGVSWYNVTAIQTTGWSSDFQIFGYNGYDVIPVPFLPSQGAFLTVGASNYGNAASAAAAFDSYLFTSFVSYSNSSGSYTFYSPLSFGNIIPSTILKLIPTWMGGFASAITPSAFVALKSPIVILQGTRGSSGFTHSLTLGSISADALDSSSRPNILQYFGTSIASLSASNKSVSSTIVFRFLDGIVNNTDHAAVSSNLNGSGEYSLNLVPGAKIKSLNVTVLHQPPLLLAERVIDRGVLMPGQNVSVSISLTNLAENTTISTVGFSDDWWKAYGFFKLVGKSSSTIPGLSLEAGGTSTPTYVLQYNGTGIRQLTVPATVVRYSFEVGTATFQGSATLNPVLLSLGTDEPVVYAYVTPAKNYGASVGSTQLFKVVAKNIGTLTASSVVIAGRQEGGLVAGGSVSANVSLKAQSLLGTNFSKSYTVSYFTPGGQSVNASTNTIPIIFSHSSMTIGFPTLTVSAITSPLKSGTINLTLALVASNRGSSNVTSFEAGGSLPTGLPCGIVKGTGLSCSAGRVSLSYPSLVPGVNQSASMEFNLTPRVNYFFSPLAYFGGTTGFNLTGMSNAAAAPTGLTLTKQFASTALFSGMSTKVTVNAVNSGPFDFYNMTVQTTADSFDTITSTSVPVKFSQDVAPGGNLTLSYVVVANSTYGNWSSSGADAELFFGGTMFYVSEFAPVVSVYQPVSVSIQTSPASPTEGKAFSIRVTLTNPSAVTISNVQFTLPIPSSTSVSRVQNATFSGGNLIVSVSQLAPHGSYSSNATAQASFGVTTLSGRLTFQFSGIASNERIPIKSIAVGEDVLTRYTLPVILVLVALLATAFYVRRKVALTAPASQR